MTSFCLPVQAATIGAFLIIENKSCQLEIYHTLQILHIVAAISGIVLFVTSFFNIAGILRDIKILFLAVSCLPKD